MAEVGHKGITNTINTVDLVASIELPVDNLLSTDSTKPLSANQGRILASGLSVEGSERAQEISDLQKLAAAQALLISALQTTLNSIPITVSGEVPVIVPESAQITLSHTPIASSVRLYFNSDICTSYTLVGAVITFPEVLYVDDLILVDYSYSRV